MKLHWRSRYINPIVALISGVILTFSFAPFHLALLAFIALIGLLLLWHNARPKQALWFGFLFGMGFFSTSVSWIFISIHRYGNTNGVIAGIMTTLFVMILSLAPALAGYLSKRCLRDYQSISSLFAIPSIWVLTEILRSYAFTGFPWVLLGQAQTHSPLRIFFQWIGVYGVSWLSVFVSVCLVMIIKESQKIRIKALSCLCILLILILALLPITFTHKIGKVHTISVVQGNIARIMKWDPIYTQHVIDTYLNLSDPLWGKTDFLIWPENAIILPNTDAYPLLNTLHSKALKTNTTFITGIPIEKNNHYYNGAIALGNAQGDYLKHHLVPFGEYLPLEQWLRGIIGFFDLPMSMLAAGPKQQKPIDIHHHPMGIAICYEIAYAQAMRNTTLTSQWLVVLSDDSWFGQSIASAQQLQMAQVRALETGRFVISATNSGETAIINPMGYVVAELPAYQAGVLHTVIWPMVGLTPWLWMGIWPIVLFCVLFVILVSYYQRHAFLMEKS